MTDIISLAEHIFLGNDDSHIQIQLPELEETTKDLAFFFVDLFRHGMVLLYGADNKVDIENISMTEFEIVKKKMNRVGIVIHLAIEEYNPSKNYENIENMPDDLPLEQYVFTLHKYNRIYQIYFEYVFWGAGAAI